MPGALRLRLFLTCWLVFTLHFATDFVREHYLVVSMVEQHSYRLDAYYGLHVDIFQNPPEARASGAHHGANPGISMLAAIPYFALRPAVDLVVRREFAARQARGDSSAVYRDDRPRRVAFYRQARERGLDLRFGLVGAITGALFMAPLSAAGVVLILSVLLALGVRRGLALGLALLYAFGTPVFLRSGFLNQNLAIGVFAFAAFVLLWNPGGMLAWSPRRRAVLAGGLGGLGFLCDYSGALPLGLLGLYAFWVRRREAGTPEAIRHAAWYGLGALPGALLLWHYQWAAFRHPFYPPQHWMAPVEWIEVGYQGVGGLSPELLGLLLFDPRFGLFVAMPLALFALAGPWLARRSGRDSPLPAPELGFCLLLAATLILFFATVQYTRLQWVTGIRYLAPAFPFLFLAAVPALLRLPRVLAVAVAVLSVTLNWSMAMVRYQGGVLDNVQRVFVEGLQLPWLTTLGKMSAQYFPWLRGPVSALPVLLFGALLVWLIWRIRFPGRPLAGPDPV